MATSLLVLLLASLQLVRVACYTLTMSPDYVRTSSDPESVTFSCTADAALTGCQFRWWDDDGKTGPLLELSRGSESQANTTLFNRWLTGYSYIGRGLGAGDCGVSLQVEGLKQWMVACRVRTDAGGWTYAWSDFTAANWAHFNNTLTPRETVVLPGGEARFTLKAQGPLSWCRYLFPSGFDLDFDEGAQSNDNTGRYRYLGGGVEGGECGLSLANVSEADNGVVRSYIVHTGSTKFDYRFMAIIVAHPPSAPSLSVLYTDTGVTATCVVHGGRPVANISWALADDVVRHDLRDDSPGDAQDEWRWPWMQGSLLQRVTLRLRDGDNGKVLRCVVSHVTLVQPLEATKVISFNKPVSTTARITV